MKWLNKLEQEEILNLIRKCTKNFDIKTNFYFKKEKNIYFQFENKESNIFKFILEDFKIKNINNDKDELEINQVFIQEMTKKFGNDYFYAFLKEKTGFNNCFLKKYLEIKIS